MNTRRPAVTGSFYPDDELSIHAMLDEQLAEARAEIPNAPRPKALIVPHAGWIYSGPIAARAYVLLEPLREVIDRVVLLGPSHFVPFEGVALPSSDAFATPLGEIMIDRTAMERIEDLDLVTIWDRPHTKEHSLEVQLPFLQRILGSFELIPIAVGDATAAQVGEVIDRLWGDDRTLILISSDLSHYENYERAREIDEATAAAIDSLSRTHISPEEACGCRPINGMIHAATARRLSCTRLDLRNSGDTAGPKDRVVGYGAWSLS